MFDDASAAAAHDVLGDAVDVAQELEDLVVSGMQGPRRESDEIGEQDGGGDWGAFGSMTSCGHQRLPHLDRCEAELSYGTGFLGPGLADEACHAVGCTRPGDRVLVVRDQISCGASRLDDPGAGVGAGQQVGHPAPGSGTVGIVASDGKPVAPTTGRPTGPIVRCGGFVRAVRVGCRIVVGRTGIRETVAVAVTCRIVGSGHASSLVAPLIARPTPPRPR